ncbi:hypothetical protein V496_03499 [Pseudogymnoascus sp. VKM F-4515 (FW-2607)]|nr:hypothetical protein V496_03499 [Pseudogymnoascus sp. VKM F-4515 (FW-2607)]
MLFTRKTALWLAILPSTLAVECIASNAIVIDLTSAGGGGGSGGGGSFDNSGTVCSDLCGTETTCLGLCEPARAIKGRKLNVRATLNCTGNEVCVTAEGLLACVDANTGDFHDSMGGIGNAITGEYTEGTSTPTVSSVDNAAGSTATTAPLSDSASTSAPALPSASDTETETETDTDTKTEAPVNGTPTTVASGSNTSAAVVTPTSGVDRLSGRSAIVGALGLLVGILAN